MTSTLLLCLNLIAMPDLPQDQAIRREVVKYAVNKFQITREDAVTIADAIIRNSKRYDVPAEIIIAVIVAESAFNKNAVSYTMARGLMQIMGPTAKEISEKIKSGPYDLHDIRTNIRFGTWYLKHLNRQFKSWDLAVRAYNCGPRRVKRVLAGEKDYPEETKRYFESILNRVFVMRAALPYVMSSAPKQIQASQDNRDETLVLVAENKGNIGDKNELRRVFAKIMFKRTFDNDRRVSFRGATDMFLRRSYLLGKYGEFDQRQLQCRRERTRNARKDRWLY